jgi:hypothetical protein
MSIATIAVPRTATWGYVWRSYVAASGDRWR